ncbi:RDD family protein [Bacillus andreraoultii]|uniref:RDD family protein n=1 Tax=Bacillus andreraoultii TaxID=1499685 RepID=UPI0009E46E6A|nr:RDD family protein [Bacillus andreraoultii]
MNRDDEQRTEENVHNERPFSEDQIRTNHTIVDLEKEASTSNQQNLEDKETLASNQTLELTNNHQQVDLYAYAGFWIRFCAYIIDVLVIVSLRQLVISPIVGFLGVEQNSGMFSVQNILSALVFYLYFVLMTKYFNQTLGKMIFGLKVIPLKETRLSWQTVIFREWIGRYISATIIILYIFVAFSPKKQGVHDYFADTTVIHENYLLKNASVS